MLKWWNKFLNIYLKISLWYDWENCYFLLSFFLRSYSYHFFFTRPFRYDLNQIPYDYTVEVRNRFKGLDLIHTVPDELWTEVRDIVQETGIKTIPKEKMCKRAKWLSEDITKFRKHFLVHYLNQYQNPLRRREVRFSSFYRWENWNSRRLWDLPWQHGYLHVRKEIKENTQVSTHLCKRNTAKIN